MGCRTRAAQAALLRVVCVDGLLVVDAARRLPGRGASVHPELHCIDLADRRRAFPRALRLTGPLDTTAVREHVTAAPAAPEAPVRPPDESRSTP